MWSVIRWLVLRFAALRWLFKLGGLGLLVPLAFLLKMIGLPLLAVLAVVGIPILILLFLFGLPVMLVLAFGGALMGLLGVVLTLSIAVVKFAVLIVLPIWLVFMVVRGACRWTGCRRKGKWRGWDSDDADSSDASDGSAPPASTPPSPPGSDTAAASDAASTSTSSSTSSAGAEPIIDLTNPAPGFDPA